MQDLHNTLRDRSRGVHVHVYADISSTSRNRAVAHPGGGYGDYVREKTRTSDGH